jgi:Uma2 family endonuclease
MAMTAPAHPRVSPEALLAMEDGPSYELLDGELVEREVSLISQYVGSLITGLLVSFARAGRLGGVYGAELGIRIFPDPDRTRRADVSFVARHRIPSGDPAFLRIPPDLLVEVVSPSNLAADVRAKVDEWIDNGVPLVWVAFPAAREVYVYRASGHHSILTATDEITGEDVLPGFACKVAEFFPDQA